jgi:hypothetical protein
VIEGKLEGMIEVTGRLGRRRKQLRDNRKEKRRYWELKEEALDRTVWRTRFGSGYGPVVRQTAERMNSTVPRRTLAGVHCYTVSPLNTRQSAIDIVSETSVFYGAKVI